MWSRALHGVEWSARHTWARYNKSLDASGTSELVIDNLSVTWLTAAASTQPFARIAVSERRAVATRSNTQLEWMIPSLPLRVLTHNQRRACLFSVNEKPVARYNQGRSNKSLDASGGSVFRNLIRPAMLD